jgi:carboxypeptidase family protein
MRRLTAILFVLVLGLFACAKEPIPGGTADATGGIQGKVRLGPMCPVQQVNSPCPDRPIKADIAVATATGAKVATGHSGVDGKYRISLPPGSYTVTATRPGAFGSGKPVTVEVPGATFVHLDLLVDSGIR